MTVSTETLFELIIERVDPDELVDVLGLTTEDLLDSIDMKLHIMSNLEKFEYLIGE